MFIKVYQEVPNQRSKHFVSVVTDVEYLHDTPNLLLYEMFREYGYYSRVILN